MYENDVYELLLDLQKTPKSQPMKTQDDWLADLKKYGQTAARQFGQGATFDMSDDMVGMMGGNQAEYQKTLDQDLQDSPMVGYPAKMVGYGVGALGVGKAMPSASLLAQGGVAGGLSGFGQSDKGNMSDLATNTTVGAGLGMATGGLLDKIAKWMPKTPNKGVNPTITNPQVFEDPAQKMLEHAPMNLPVAKKKLSLDDFMGQKPSVNMNKLAPQAPKMIENQVPTPEAAIKMYDPETMKGLEFVDKVLGEVQRGELKLDQNAINQLIDWKQSVIENAKNYLN